MNDYLDSNNVSALQRFNSINMAEEDSQAMFERKCIDVINAKFDAKQHFRYWKGVSMKL